MFEGDFEHVAVWYSSWLPTLTYTPLCETRFCINNRKHSTVLGCSDCHPRTPSKTSCESEGWLLGQTEVRRVHSLATWSGGVTSVHKSRCPRVLDVGPRREQSGTEQPSSPPREAAWDSDPGPDPPAGGYWVDGRQHAQVLTRQCGAADGTGWRGDLGLLLSALCRRKGWLFWLLGQVSGAGSSFIFLCLCWNSQFGKWARTEFMSVAFSIWRVGCG